MSAISIPCPVCGQGLKIRDRSLLGRKAKCPKCGHTFVLQESAEVELRFASAEPPRGVSPSPAGSAPVAEAPPQVFAPAPVSIPAAPSGVGRLRELRKKNARGRWIGLIFTLLILAGAAGGGYLLYTQQQAASQLAKTKSTAVAASGSTVNARTIARTPTGVSVPPTQGKPISLATIPAGARTLLHLRPAELWASGSPGEEFRYCLGPLGVFVDQQIQTLCGRPAADIEELLLAWIPGQRGTPPDLALLVTLKKEAKKSELLDLLGGEVNETYGRPVYVNGDRAAVIVDLKTYAIGPATMAEDLVNGLSAQNPMPTGIEALLEQTDRERHITLIFEPTAVLLDAEFMAPLAAQPFLRQCMDWFADDAETVAWSLHLESDRFYSDLRVRNTTTVRPVALEEALRERIDQLPAELLPNIQRMQPGEQGKREIIGRLPAMSKVVAMATLTDHGPRHVQLITPLPDRAAPNLALATLLAWDESTRTDFTRALPMPSPSAQPLDLPATVADRLKLKIDVDFRRTPLQEAFAYIAEETHVIFDIDGDALKLAGYTQNMPQSFKLDQVPATQALTEILKQYDKMCIVLDEPKKTAIVMTFAVAEQKQLTPLPLVATPTPK